MGFAFITCLEGLLRPLRRLLGRRAAAPEGTNAARCAGLHTAAGRGFVAWPAAARGPQGSRPLRVLRIVDAGHAPSTAGRMVISGRLADVCAELDRLVAAEATAA